MVKCAQFSMRCKFHHLARYTGATSAWWNNYKSYILILLIPRLAQPYGQNLV